MIPIFDYETMDIDNEIFMTEIPEHIIENCIKSQFKNPLDNRKRDYVQSFITKYKFTKQRCIDNEDEDEQNELNIAYNQFMTFMCELFETKLGIGICETDVMDEDDLQELIHLTYRFFIRNIRKNFVNLVLNWISDNQQTLFEVLPQKKDVTTLNFKDEEIEEIDVLVISNMSRTVEMCLQEFKEENNIDAFFAYCDKDEPCLETEFVKSKFDEFILTGNFIPKYIGMIIKNNGVKEIESKVRNRILQWYSKRDKKKLKEIEDN